MTRRGQAMSGRPWLLLALASLRLAEESPEDCGYCMHGLCVPQEEGRMQRCYCTNGYTGYNCATDYDDCRSAPCLSGGTCIDLVAGFRCLCPAGYTGTSCETDIDECRSSPCLHGATCIDRVGGFDCVCAPGYKGDICDVDVSVCNGTVSCFNGGVCDEGPGETFTCRCAPGYTGLLCEEDVDECLQAPCHHGGTCSNYVGGFTCSCVFGWTGSRCQEAIQKCRRNFCLNGGLCVVHSTPGLSVGHHSSPLAEDFPWECFCVPGFHGVLCERRYNECIPGHDCQNGGSCVDGVDDYTCACTAPFTGKHCEIPCIEDDNLCQEYYDFSITYFTGIGPRVSATTARILPTSVVDVDVSLPSRGLPEFTAYTFAFSTSYSTLSASSAGLREPTKSQPLLESYSTLAATSDQSPAYFFELSSTADMQASAQITGGIDVFGILSTLGGPQSGSEPGPPGLSPSSLGLALVSSSEFVGLGHTYGEDTFATPQLSPTSFSEGSLTQRPVPATRITSLPTSSPSATLVEPTVHSQQSVPVIIGANTLRGSLADSSGGELVGTLATPYTPWSVPHITTRLDSTPVLNVPPKCTWLQCMNGGEVELSTGLDVTCKCRCPVGYTGKRCQLRDKFDFPEFKRNSFLEHKIVVRPGARTLDVDLSFEARSADGRILSAVAGSREQPSLFLALYLHRGEVRLAVACGTRDSTIFHSSVNVTSTPLATASIELTWLTYPDSCMSCSATLRVNGSEPMTASHPAVDFEPTGRLFLGSHPSEVTLHFEEVPRQSFLGCMGYVQVNGMELKLVTDAENSSDIVACGTGIFGGRQSSSYGKGKACSPASTSGPAFGHRQASRSDSCLGEVVCSEEVSAGRNVSACLCPYEKRGKDCSEDVAIAEPSFAGDVHAFSSYLEYALPTDVADTAEFRISFWTEEILTSSLLAFVGQYGDRGPVQDFMAVVISDGRLFLYINLGSGTRELRSGRLPLGTTHTTVSFGHRRRFAWLSVQGLPRAVGLAPGPLRALNIHPTLFVGGHPSRGLLGLPLMERRPRRGFIGCVLRVEIRSSSSHAFVSPKEVLKARNVDQCPRMKVDASASDRRGQQGPTVPHLNTSASAVPCQNQR